jgi:hypothetical protein
MKTELQNTLKLITLEEIKDYTVKIEDFSTLFSETNRARR